MDLDLASADDLDAVHALIESAYRGDSARRGWTHEADLLGGQRTDRAALGDILADPRQQLLLHRSGAAIDGCVAVTQKAGGLVYIGLVTVDPARQGSGLGRALLAAAEDYASRQLGADRAEMTVIVQRPELIAWYERRGYRVTGERRPFPIADPRFGLPKRPDLEFLVLEKSLRSPSPEG